MTFPQFVEWVFYALIGGVSLQVAGKLGKLTESITALNEKIAVVIEKTAWHEKQLEKHDAEIEALKGIKPKRR
jgi:hypothetical protein